MTSDEKHRKLRRLRDVRDEANRHLERTMRQQQEMPAFLPSLSNSVVLELITVVDRLNEQIDEMIDEFTAGDGRLYVQQAFDFLYKVALDENEIPF